MKIKQRLLLALTIIAILGTAGYFLYSQKSTKIETSGDSRDSPVFVQNTLKPQDRAPQPTQIENNTKIIAENLDIPWEITFLPQGDLLVTERPGTLLRLSAEEQMQIPIEGVAHRGEGGLLGLVLHPDFENNNLIYLYLTTETEEGLTNRVEQYRLENDSVTKTATVVEGIPGASYHDGGRMAIGPDGRLYITTGDAGEGSLAQDKNSLAGKILRLNLDGSIPDDNPFGNEVWTYGHRNPQGLAWDSDERLWATEHGPSGLQSGQDEINLIERGENYGWPQIRGNETREGMTAPVIQSGTDTTWAPAGAAIINGTLYYAGLRGSALYTATLEETEVTELTTNLKDEYGRLRAVVEGPDGFLYISTSNTDGRGDPDATDDKIIRVDPKVLN